ncbi:MAG: hypothetical protein ACKVP7_02230 [Hyphomicrobiaceae bacterium]
MAETEPSCRIYAVLARNGLSAVVFRRGPSKQVCMLRWWLRSDKLDIGQWFKGRVYERRSDLSPDGELLVYLAAKHTGLNVWNAISRPPYFTALALWSNLGTWGGGGLFETDRSLGLNTPHQQPSIHGDFKLPKNFNVTRVADWGGSGEDNPIEHARMERDGWRITVPGKHTGYKREAPARWTLKVPETYERAQPGIRHKAALKPELRLRRELRAIAVTEGPWLLHDFSLHSDAGELRRFTGCDWADWQSNGDLLLATHGCLYRLPALAATRAAAQPLNDTKLVADLNPLRFTPVAPPHWATQWP